MTARVMKSDTVVYTEEANEEGTFPDPCFVSALLVQDVWPMIAY